VLDRILKTETCYRIVEKLRDVGPGDLYLGRKLSIGTLVCLRRLEKSAIHRSEPAGEIKVLASYAHPGLIRTHDYFEQEGDLWLVSDYVPGEYLNTVIDRRSPSLEEAKNWAVQILESLSYLHQRGSVHGNLRPDQFILDDDGRLHIVDIISPILCGPQAAPDRTYLAPEQRRGGKADKAGDVFAAGVIIYRLVAGKLPFDDDSGVASSLASLCGLHLAPLDPVLARALTQTASDRFEDGGALLQAFLAGAVKIQAAAEAGEVATEFLSGTQVSRVLEGRAGAVNIQPTRERSISIPWSGGGEEDLPFKDQDTQKMDLSGIWASRSSVIKDGSGEKKADDREDKTRAMGEETLRSILEKGKS